MSTGKELLAELSTLTVFKSLQKGRNATYFTDAVIEPNVRKMALWA
jgi:hypothetical protein